MLGINSPGNLMSILSNSVIDFTVTPLMKTRLALLVRKLLILKEFSFFV